VRAHPARHHDHPPHRGAKHQGAKRPTRASRATSRRPGAAPAKLAASRRPEEREREREMTQQEAGASSQGPAADRADARHVSPCRNHDYKSSLIETTQAPLPNPTHKARLKSTMPRMTRTRIYVCRPQSRTRDTRYRTMKQLSSRAHAHRAPPRSRHSPRCRSPRRPPHSGPCGRGSPASAGPPAALGRCRGRAPRPRRRAPRRAGSARAHGRPTAGTRVRSAPATAPARLAPARCGPASRRLPPR